ncbi:succinoglycan biosynthesis protein ExoA [Kineosphaera limosa]|uniref:4,4'-diaponeurosporenoate glycosyltransferase n=1 Tax=Kineosphaera limosa NBRC 100340 TaxID=1184609 RepID=K6W598_9MICO|nr:glycosyltransferase family 2 protein [Kineosphaera limosa]NYE02895.1 succinoglycan biosynthesis protein ExoA [Kineosphaera limosa]GAB94325.1 putative glycosyltransferase [Kineosphaera limosa NBRC 100340]
MSVLVVMPTLNEERFVGEAVRQLLRDTDDVPLRLVVADGGSRDRTRAVVSQLAAHDPRIELLDNPGRTQSRGVNLAVSRAAADVDIVVRTDCHAAYPAGFLRRVVQGLRELRDQGCVSVVVPMVADGGTPFQHAVAQTQNSLLGNGGSAHRRLGESRYVDHGHHAAFDRAAFERVGGYDPRMMHNEDAELDVRLAGDGGRIFLDTGAAITYFPRRTWRALARQQYNHGRGRAWNTVKHHSKPKLRQIAPAAVTALNSACLLVATRHRSALVPPLAYAGACLAVAARTSLERHDRDLLLMGPIAMLTHHAWGTGFIGGLLRHPDFTAAPDASSPQLAERHTLG